MGKKCVVFMLAILLSTSLLSNIAAAEPERSGITNEWNIYGATVHPTEAPQSQETEAVTQRIPPAVIWSCIGIAAVAVLALLVWILNKKKAV